MFFKKGKEKRRGKRIWKEDLKSRIRGLEDWYKQGTISEDTGREAKEGLEKELEDLEEGLT